jgi:hypothetical protein
MKAEGCGQGVWRGLALAVAVWLLPLAGWALARGCRAGAAWAAGSAALLAAWAPFFLFLLVGETVLIRTEE